jgi:type IV secretion system protein VirD4
MPSAGAAVSAAATGKGSPSFTTDAPITLLTHPSTPALAFGPSVGPAWWYWVTTATVTAIVLIVVLLLWRRGSTSRATPVGCASGAQVAATSGRRALLRRASMLRPSLTVVRAQDVGYRLGSSRGVESYASVEDSMVILGPPRAGKGLHLVIPMILGAPGAVLTTSTRPNNLTTTLRARSRRGPVAVFDPQGLAPGIASATRWSPIRGCQDPHIAMVRAKALTTNTAAGTTDSTFWQASAEQAVRCLLHAAALAECVAADIYRWSLSAAQARKAVLILATDTRAAPSWHQALDAIINADARQRDSIWAMVTIAFSALADPRVLDAVSPRRGEHFDPEEFLRNNGTVYLLGTSTGIAATAALVGAFVEDVVEAARRIAARSPASRLDPPLSLVLDEAANYPLPSLPSLMSDGGGSGLSTIVVLQSLAQARAVWGENQASAIWDAAIVKTILGGGSNARDLEDLSKLLGQRDERNTSSSRGPDGRRSTSTTTTKVPILEPSALRTLPFGQAILLMKSAPPIALTLSPWTGRKDAKALTADREDSEAAIRTANATTAGYATPGTTTTTPPQEAGHRYRSVPTDSA